MSETSEDQALRDPTKAYPKPPFEKQSQPWPGLASKMTPPPDHGEKTYRGSGRLTGRKALITGGDSGMGRAAAIAYAREGADVAINYHPDEEDGRAGRDRAHREAGRKGVAIPGDLRDESFCMELVGEAVRELGGLDILVSNAGRQQAQESILDISTEEFDATMKTNIYAPFWIIKAALPHLKPGSVIIGTTSEQAYDPSPDLYDYAQTKAATMNYREVAGEAACDEGHPRQWRGARADLDAAAGQRRRQHGEAGEIRRPDSDGASWPAGRARLHLCAACSGRCELCDGTGLWVRRRLGAALKHGEAGARTRPARSGRGAATASRQRTPTRTGRRSIPARELSSCRIRWRRISSRRPASGWRR